MASSKHQPRPASRGLERLPERVSACVEASRISAKLTRAQVSVFRHLIVGDSNKDIARALKCAPRTIEVHVAGVLGKLGVDSRARLIANFWMDAFERCEG
jgi:DNA-binding NarL/FixJ family response regulator